MHLSLSLSAVFSTGALLLGRAGVHTSRAGTPTAASIAVPEASQLAQLARMTTLSIDTGDLDIIKAYGATGLITDATTNPLFVSQAGLSGDARYIAFVDSAIAYAKKNAKGTEAVLELAMDRLAVELGLEIVKLVPGYVSTEVDIRASFDTAESIARARRIIAMYEAAGVPRSRVLVKLAGTWEGIQAAKVLEKEGITCNITLIFGFIQAVAAAQAGARLSTAFETEAEIDCPETESEIDIHAVPFIALQCPAVPFIARTSPCIAVRCPALCALRTRGSFPIHRLSLPLSLLAVSPFPGRIKDWAGANGGKKAYEPSEDPGVKSVSRMYAYYKKFGHENTICMPASWRPSRSTPADKIAEHATDEIVALAGVDRSGNTAIQPPRPYSMLRFSACASLPAC